MAAARVICVPEIASSSPVARAWLLGTGIKVIAKCTTQDSIQPGCKKRFRIVHVELISINRDAASMLQLWLLLLQLEILGLRQMCPNRTPLLQLFHRRGVLLPVFYYIGVVVEI